MISNSLPLHPGPKSRTRVLASAALLGAVFASCTADLDAPSSPGTEPVSSVTQGLAHGTFVADAAHSGFVVMVGGDWCSGTLLTNSWVLTAQHCKYTLGAADGVTVTMGNLGAPDAQQQKSDFVVGHPSLDFALVHVSSPFVMNGSTSGYRLGMYTDSAQTLNGRQLKFFGYSSKSDTENYYWPSFGILREAAFIGSPDLDAYNYGAYGVNGAAAVEGDSGGGMVLDALSGRVLAGVEKSGGFGLPKNFRDWALSYIYGRPVQLPDTWYLPGTPHPDDVTLTFEQAYPDCRADALSDTEAKKNLCSKFLTNPLPNGYQNTRTWDPCPNMGSYSWFANYDFEQNKDYLTISSPGSSPVKLTGKSRYFGTGKGPITVQVTTDGQNQSQGLLELPILCSANKFGLDRTPRFVCHGEQCFTSPEYLSGTTSIVGSFTPCGGRTWHVGVDYDFSAGQNYAELRGNFYGNFAHLAGKGSLNISGTGTIQVSVKTSWGSAAMAGIKAMRAICEDWSNAETDDPGTQCNGMHCCPAGSAMVGANIGTNTFKCLQVTNPGNESCRVDPSTQRFDMHACAPGEYMRGLHVGQNLLTCCKDTTVPQPEFMSESIDQSSAAMHACALPSVMTGIRIDRQQLLCATTTGALGCGVAACSAEGKTCGEIVDKCGRKVQCGVCAQGYSCGDPGHDNVCVPTCKPLTCKDLATSCGPVDDGCGYTLECGNCNDNQTCWQGSCGPLRHTLTVSASGQGKVVSAPSAIDCGGTCSASFIENSKVTLTALPAAGWMFAGWQVNTCGNPCTLAITEDKRADAIFKPIPPTTATLTVTTSGAGSVYSSPAGIACGTSCSASYAINSVVTLTATPASGYLFSGWSGACAGLGPCTVTLDAAKTVGATFALAPPTTYTFTVKLQQGGDGCIPYAVGDVKASTFPFTCHMNSDQANNTCSMTLPAGTQVSLMAKGSYATLFSQWDGDCSGTTTCDFTLDRDKGAIATFCGVVP